MATVELFNETSTPSVLLLGDLVQNLVAENDKLAEARLTGKPLGPKSGIEDLDTVLGGYFFPGVHIIQAAPGAGKTAFCLQTAAECEFPALYVSAEMPSSELFRRLIARATETPLGDLKSGKLSSEEVRQKALQTVKQSPWLAILDATAEYAPSPTILDAVQGLKAKSGFSQVLVVLDSLQVWARSAGTGDRGGTEYDLINFGIDTARSLASCLGSPILAVSHKNRNGNQGKGNSLHASKGSGDLEYAAETVIDLEREEGSKVTQSDSQNITVHLRVYKNRHGATNPEGIPLHFNGGFQSFSEV